MLTYATTRIRLAYKQRVRSGPGTWTRPDPSVSGPDPTRRMLNHSGPDQTRPDPTRWSTRPGNNSDYEKKFSLIMLFLNYKRASRCTCIKFYIVFHKYRDHLKCFYSLHVFSDLHYILQL